MRLIIGFCFIAICGYDAIGQSILDCQNAYLKAYNPAAVQCSLGKMSKPDFNNLANKLADELGECLVGKEFPDVRFVTSDGRIYTKDSLKGKVVLLNFWALSCGPCVGEIPLLNRLVEYYQETEDFLFLSVLSDNVQDLEKFRQGKFSKRIMDFQIVPGAQQLMKEHFRFINGFPTNIFVDRDGKIYCRTFGGVSAITQEPIVEENMHKIIDEMLAKK